MKFLALYRSSQSAKAQMTSMTPEEGKAGMDMWMTWFGKVGSSIVEMGAPLGDSATVGGPAASGFLGGYTIVQADSLDEAQKLFEGHPHLHAPNGSIEVVEILPQPGM